jgi:hypothetical protein
MPFRRGTSNSKSVAVFISDTSHTHLLHGKQMTSLPEIQKEEVVTETSNNIPGNTSEPMQQIAADGSRLMFEIASDDGFKVQAESMDEAWKMLTEKLQDARSNARMKQLSFAGRLSLVYKLSGFLFSFF